MTVVPSCIRDKILKAEVDMLLELTCYWSIVVISNSTILFGPLLVLDKYSGFANSVLHHSPPFRIISSYC